ncbi:MAG: addiction module protein [Polyangiales bacterium]
MSRSSNAILADAMQLPSEERERIALTLLDSIGKAPDDELDDAWREEVARRLDDLHEGRAIARPWDEVRADLRAKLRGP